jgi:transposase
MPKPYSVDLRQRVVDAYEEGNESFKAVAEKFSIGVASVDRWVSQYRRTGSVTPKPATGGQPSKLEGEGLDAVHILVLEKPDIIEHEIARALAEIHSIHVSRSSVNRSLKRLGITRKKRPSPPPNAKASESSSSGVTSKRRSRSST